MSVIVASSPKKRGRKAEPEALVGRLSGRLRLDKEPALRRFFEKYWQASDNRMTVLREMIHLYLRHKEGSAELYEAVPTVEAVAIEIDLEDFFEL